MEYWEDRPAPVCGSVHWSDIEGYLCFSRWVVDVGDFNASPGSSYFPGRGLYVFPVDRKRNDLHTCFFCQTKCFIIIIIFCHIHVNPQNAITFGAGSANYFIRSTGEWRIYYWLRWRPIRLKRMRIKTKTRWKILSWDALRSCYRV